MGKLNAYINNAIAQLFDELEVRCGVKFATFTASDLQGQKNLAAGKRQFMDDTINNESHGIYKYLYDPELAFDFRFHQRLAAAPFAKTDKPWATIMFSTKQTRSLTNILSHLYTETHYDENGVPFEVHVKRTSVPVNMVIVSNDIDKLYHTTELISMYFDRFINFQYDQVIDVTDSFQIKESRFGQAANIKEIDLTKLDTAQRGSLVTQAYSFDLVYFVIDTPGTQLHLLKKIIFEIQAPKGRRVCKLVITEDGVEEEEE